MEILSTIVSVVSIVLGIYAIVQAERYNKESEKVNADTRKILNLHSLTSKYLKLYYKHLDT